MFTGRAKAYSSSCSQTVSLSPAILSRLLRGYRSLMPSCAGFFEHRKSRLGPSKSTFNAENFICSSLMFVLIGVTLLKITLCYVCTCKSFTFHVCAVFHAILAILYICVVFWCFAHPCSFVFRLVFFVHACRLLHLF